MVEYKTVENPFTLVGWLNANKLNPNATVGQFYIRNRYKHIPKKYKQLKIYDFKEFSKNK